MSNVIQFPIKPKPKEEQEVTMDERIRQERLRRIRESLDQVNELMRQLNKIKGKDYDIFED